MRFPRLRSFALISGLLALGAVNPAMAQLMPPPQVNPGAVDTPAYAPMAVEEPMQKEQEQSGLQVPDQPNIVQVDSDLFQVNRIDVQGNAILSDEELRRIVAPYEDRKLSAEELTTIVARINQEYRSRGFLTSLAFIPPQDLERGAITVKVLEGMIGDMEIQGNKYFKAKVIEKRIAAKPGEPLNIPELEKELLRINRLEPFKVKATLSPGERTGETKIHLDIKEQQPFQITLSGDNMGRPYIGTYRGGVEFADRNVTGHGDRFNARWVGAAGTQLASASYTYPLGSRGTELTGLFGFNHVDVDLDLKDQPPIIGNGYNYGLLLSQPLDRDRTWVADFGLNARRVSTFFDGDKTSTTDIRAFQLGLNYNRYDRYGRSFGRIATSLAPEWLGANTSFIKLESYLNRTISLPKNNMLLLSAYSQWTPDDLPPAEQFQLGGMNSVRGYTQGLLLGDRGYNVSAEWRWPIPMVARINPWVGQRVRGSFFVDYGQSWLDGKDSQSLLGAGIGLRAHLTDYVQGYVDFAFGLLKRDNIEPHGQPTARVHFGVRSELLPNEYKDRAETVTPIKTNVFRPRNVGALREEELQSDISEPTLEPTDTLFRQNIY
jgi:hemolysin activation/secretion protein